MKIISYLEAIREAIIESMQENETMFIMGQDIGWRGGVFGIEKGLIEMFPGRVIDTPISELAIAGAAYGASITGATVCAIFMYSDFSLLGMDQIINSAAKSRYIFGGQTSVPVVFRMSSGSGRQMAAQHSQSLEALYGNVPGLKIIMPSTPNDAKGLLKSAFIDKNPIIFLEHRLLYDVKAEIEEGKNNYIPIGLADIKRDGNDITVVATAFMVQRALKVAEEMRNNGISIEVIDPRTIKPLDKKTIIESIKKTGKLVIVHEAPLLFGIGAEISAMINEEGFDYLDSPIIRVAGKECPIPYNKTLEYNAIPTEEDIKKE